MNVKVRYAYMLQMLAVLCLIFILASCKTKTKQNSNGLHFTLVNSSTSNIDFNNKITESDSINVIEDEYMYNGSGVGIGDFNNDGLPDIFFSGSMVSCKLYINKGNFKFEDVTEKAGLLTNRWCTGVSVVDINNDGFMDIYICSSHAHNKEKRKNLLYINDGKMHFSEQAEAYGLADTGYATQAAFFDYDKDGDLDMYLLNHRLYNKDVNNIAPKDTSGNAIAQDRLFRNDGVRPGQSNPVFTDVTKKAGIVEDGYGLGVVITDVNNDNWPDVYVANDYLANDLLWLNNRNGTFSNIIGTSLNHQSYNSMGADAADINNDALPDIAVLDMMPEVNERKKMMYNGSTPEKYDMERRRGYEPSFIRNMLQLNNGLHKVNNQQLPFYSEIGQLAGISETDWSWSVLMADFDNDGFKDIHIGNGLAKDVINNDFLTFRNAQSNKNYAFGSKDGAGQLDKKSTRLLLDNLDTYGSLKINSYYFHNNGNLTFSDITKETGLAIPGVSNGVAYVDLDNDGDLDIVVNNMNQEAFVWKNELRKSINDSTNNFLTIELKGATKNLQGFGSKATLYLKNTTQFLEQSPVRGFSSAVDYRLHFGIGNSLLIDSIKIQWPDDKIQVLHNVKANQILSVKYEDAVSYNSAVNEVPSSVIFNELTGSDNIIFDHKESEFFDFGGQRGMLQKYSQMGPPVISGDVNGDGLMDFFIGGAAIQSGKVFIQNKNGSFTSHDLINNAKHGEDLGAIFFDSDGDKDLDLLITGGSTEYGSALEYNSPKLYINDGKGNFTLDPLALPAGITCITKAVTVADYDGDGDMDIFIGGRVVPQKYPMSPRSYILQNNKGKFKDVTKEVCPALEYAGMVTGAVFADFNNNKKSGLVICGEWMPVRFFENKNGKFNEITEHTGLEKMNGQWRCISAADIDNDGDIDFVVGNLGLNNKFHVTAEKPFKLYAADFDGNNFIDIIPAYFMKNSTGKFELFPGLDRAQLADQLPFVKKKYLLNKDFSKLTMQDLVNNIDAKDLVVKNCETLASVWIENLKGGKFKVHELATEAQFAPVNSIIASDMNGDGIKDILLAGNEYQSEVISGRYDASYGLFLKGKGNNKFEVVSPLKSGFIINGDVRGMEIIKAKKGNLIIAAINNSPVKSFRIK